MQNYFGFSTDSIYHLSVGAVLRNKDGQIGVHHFDASKGDFYILMRETIEPNETIETALARGLREEFGATATLRRYLGPIISRFPDSHGRSIHKTTLYFLMDLQKLGDWPKHDGESDGALEWRDPEFLIKTMKAQAKRLHREDWDESAVLERLRDPTEND